MISCARSWARRARGSASALVPRHRRSASKFTFLVCAGALGSCTTLGEISVSTKRSYARGKSESSGERGLRKKQKGRARWRLRGSVVVTTLVFTQDELARVAVFRLQVFSLLGFVGSFPGITGRASMGSSSSESR